MIVLAMDTSNATCCAGVYKDKEEITYKMSFERKTHSEVFMPMVHSVMEESGLSHKQIDAYAITVGPGSFTGIRIGLSAVKGMSVASKVKCIDVSSTKALARSVDVLEKVKDVVLVPCFDARNNRVFGACYDSNSLGTLVDENAYYASDLVQEISRIADIEDKKIIVCGNGAPVVQNAIEALSQDLRAKINDVEQAEGAAILPRGVNSEALDIIEKNPEALVSGDRIKAEYFAVSSAQRHEAKGRGAPQ